MKGTNVIFKMTAVRFVYILGKHNAEQRRSLFVRQFELFGEFVLSHAEEICPENQIYQTIADI
jgi:hypothetical protein